MKISYLITCFVFLYFFDFNAVFAQSDEISAKSVVKIIASHLEMENGKQVKKLATATAWCWKEPTLVVTALHAVAGVDQILVSKNNEKSCNAKVVSVLKEADLALLRLDADLALVPLNLEKADPNSKTEYSIWGFPQGVYSIQGDDIRLSRSLEAHPTLNSILTGNDLKHDLKMQGYPLPEAKIFRVSSIIQPGHSGAPILTSTGKVIGVADGGLRSGTARINWAMPAAFYVPLLLDSKDQKPVNPSLQASLYSSSVTVDRNTSLNDGKVNIKKASVDNKVENGKKSISKTWTANYATIFKTLDDYDKKELNDFLKEFKVNITDTQYDVYEDYETHATLSVPHGAILSVQNGWYYAHNPEASLHYYTLPFNAQTYPNALDNLRSTMKSIMGHFDDGTPWAVTQGTKDRWLEDKAKQTLKYEAERTNKKKYFCFIAKIVGGNLLVAGVMADNDKMENAAYLKKFAHYLLAANMIDLGGK